MMRVSVLGASGRSGRAVARRLVDAGHEVVSIVRTASRAPAGTIVVEADGRNAAGVGAGLDGSDALVFCIGPVARTDDHTVMRESMRATLDAMAERRVRRLVVITASGPFVGGDDPLSRYLAKPILRMVLRDAFADLRATDALVQSSDSEWTIIRPSALVDRSPRAGYRHRVDRNLPFGFQTSREDVARAVLDALATPAWIGHTVAVAS